MILALQLALVLTDGSQTDEGDPEGAEEKLAAAAQLLKDKGVEVLSLGVGRKVNIFQLLNIATSEEQLYRASFFEELLGVVDELTKRECLGWFRRLSLGRGGKVILFHVIRWNEVDSELFSDLPSHKKHI